MHIILVVVLLTSSFFCVASDVACVSRSLGTIDQIQELLLHGPFGTKITLTKQYELAVLIETIVRSRRVLWEYDGVHRYQEMVASWLCELTFLGSLEYAAACHIFKKQKEWFVLRPSNVVSPGIATFFNNYWGEQVVFMENKIQADAAERCRCVVQ